MGFDEVKGKETDDPATAKATVRWLITLTSLTELHLWTQEHDSCTMFECQLAESKTVFPNIETLHLGTHCRTEALSAALPNLRNLCLTVQAGRYFRTHNIGGFEAFPRVTSVEVKFDIMDGRFQNNVLWLEEAYSCKPFPLVVYRSSTNGDRSHHKASQYVVDHIGYRQS